MTAESAGGVPESSDRERGLVPESLSNLVEMLAGARRIVVLTGASISTDSGIPDYRGPAGVWTRDPEAARLSAIITQNIDGLHQKAGSDLDRVLEVHGSMSSVECWNCANRSTMAEALARVSAGEPDPPCQLCGGILKSSTIFFGQSLDEATLRRAADAATDADAFLTVGTSLQVYPVAGLVDIAAQAGAQIVIVNREPTPYDRIADAVVRDPIGEVVPALVAALTARP